MAPYYTNEEYIKATLLNGFVPPEAFVYLDESNYIQNTNGIQIFYHYYRRANIKAFNYNEEINPSNFRHDTSLIYSSFEV
ncbi:hypothetical protein FF38_01098 [Lucilia cuprina]|uniref:Uncharacterized protein n=1 Tax=Lucilia cuprina TaxID=7375 RepID=A0A0L0C4P4_LUCCU|nr:hypothetical protein FF38_01098 [Lucilia cuprina]